MRYGVKHKILVVDDKLSTLKVLGAILEDEGFLVLKARGAEHALKLLEETRGIDVILADLKMPGMDGLDLFRTVKVTLPGLPFIIMTAHGTVESAVEAMKEGINNYIIKPLNYDELGIILNRAIQDKALSQELAELRKEVKEKYFFRNIIGTCSQMRKIFEIIESVAPTDASVLIKGESGTGKELIAKAIHALSLRYDKPLVCINCASLNESLLEAELFGYVKGAFTGAISDRKGRLEIADGGTLFLDEMAHMSIGFQTKLLRFLQEGTFEPVGSFETKQADVRILAATNKNPKEEIRKKKLLIDLYYRINVVPINLPPLNERGEDIIHLTHFFLGNSCQKYNKTIDGIAPAVLNVFKQYAWPGNVRELENCIARAVIMCKKDQIGPSDIPGGISSLIQEDTAAASEEFLIDEFPDTGITLKKMEQLLISKSLEKAGGNKTLAASWLGISRKALYEKIKRFKIAQTT